MNSFILGRASAWYYSSRWWFLYILASRSCSEIGYINLHSRCSGLQPIASSFGGVLKSPSVQWEGFLYNDVQTSSALLAKVVSNKVLGAIMTNARQPDYSKFSHWLTYTIWLDSNVFGMARDSKEMLLNLYVPALWINNLIVSGFVSLDFRNVWGKLW